MDYSSSPVGLLLGTTCLGPQQAKLLNTNPLFAVLPSTTDTRWVFYPCGRKSMTRCPWPTRPDLRYEHSMCKHLQWCKKFWQPNSLSLSHTHQFWVREKLLHVSLIIMSLRSYSSKREKSKEGKKEKEHLATETSVDHQYGLCFGCWHDGVETSFPKRRFSK